MSSGSKSQKAKQETDMIKITVKTQSRNEDFVVPQVATVADIKPEIAERFHAETTQLCLIYAGRPLNDTGTLGAQNVKNGFAIHLVIRPRNPPPPTVAAEPPREAIINHPPAAPQNPLSDITAGLLSSPEYIRSLISMDPRLQAYLDQNPDVAHIINNPSLMREYLQIASNPATMQEFLRGQDLTMRNIENTPGGFAALESIYNNLSDLDSVGPNINTPARPNANAPPSTVDPSQINSSPLPNPWSTETTHQQNDTTNMPDLQQIAQMLSNPQMQQLLRDMAADPAFLQMLLNNNAQESDQESVQANLSAVLRNMGGIAGMPSADEMRSYLGQMQPSANEPPETRYSNQLEQLNSMGFTNRDANLQALAASMGDLNAAIDILTRSLQMN